MFKFFGIFFWLFSKCSLKTYGTHSVNNVSILIDTKRYRYRIDNIDIISHHYWKSTTKKLKILGKGEKSNKKIEGETIEEAEELVCLG